MVTSLKLAKGVNKRVDADGSGKCWAKEVSLGVDLRDLEWSLLPGPGRHRPKPREVYPLLPLLVWPEALSDRR